MSILVLADERDPTADHMIGVLLERDAVVHRVDTAWFPVQLSMSAELNGGHWSGQLKTPHRTIELDGITAVWFRSPRAYSFPEGMSGSERWHANIEAKYGLGGILTSLPVVWVNHPGRLAEAAYKPVQLAVAQRCGLNVAPTLLTNAAESVREFVSGGASVSKTLGANTILEDGVRKRRCTERLNPDDLADLRGIENTVHQFQRWVPKSYEVRVIAVGSTLSGVAIHAGSDDAYVDYRADYPSLRYEQIALPEDVEVGVRGLMKELDLVYGALDFVVSPDGSWTFLEVNAGGQYGWLEHHTQIPITHQVADVLTGGHCDRDLVQGVAGAGYRAD